MFFKFFPSEIARLVLGYLKEAKCPQSWQTFLSESPDLQEYYRIYQEGEEYPTFVDGKSLIETLQEYRRLKDEVQRNIENQSHSRQAGASTSNPEVFKSPRKTVENPHVNYKVNQRAHSQSTITSIHYTQSREKLPRPSDNVTSTPSRVTTPKHSRRLQGVQATHLNFDADKETNASANEGDEISRRLSGTTMRTPSRNISTSWAFRATTPSRRTCQTDPARRKVNFLSRTPQTEPVAKSKDLRDPQTKQSTNNLQKELISHLPEQEKLTEEPFQNQKLLLGSNEASTSGMQSSIINQCITLRTSEVMRSEDNITITTTKSSFTPQNEGEPPIYHRAPDTNSPRLVLSYDRSQISSLSTPMKDRKSWTEDFASPRRKGFIPRRRLMNESPNPKQVASNELPLGSLPELNFSFLEEFLNNPPFVQKIADNINKAIHNDEPTAPEGSIATGFPTLQDIHGSEDIIKSVLARTEADPMFDKCLSLLYSSREWDEVNATQESSNLGNPDIGASSSILAETPDQGVLNTPTQPTVSSSRIEVTKDIQNDPTRNPSQNCEPEKITEATITPQDSSSISNTNNANNINANGNSSVTPVSITDGSIIASASSTDTQTQVLDNKQQDSNTATPNRTLDVLDSCMSIIQPDPEGVVHDDEESTPVAIPEPEFVMDIEDKTIKQVPIGTPCQLETQMAPNQTACGNPIPNQTTPASVVQSQTVSFVSTPVQSSQSRNVTLIPAVQNIGNMYSTISPSPTISQLPYSSIYIPTMGSNPFNLQSNFPCGFIVNSGNNWFCSNMSNNVVMPVQNLPAIAKTVPIQSMPVVNQSPIKIPHDYSPTKAFCGNSAIQTENVGNFVTVTASATEMQPKNIINKKKTKSLLEVASSQIKKGNNKKTKKKKKRRALFPTPSKETLENIVSEDVGDFPVLSVPEPSPGKSDSLSAMELFTNITENKSPQSPLLKEVLSRAKILAGRVSFTNSPHVRTLEFTSPNSKGNSSKNSKLPPPKACEGRRSSPRLKHKSTFKSRCCSPLDDNKTQSKGKVSSAPLSGTPEKKSPKKSVSMAEAVLVAMELAVQSKPLNSTKRSKDCASKEEISVIKSSKSGNKGYDIVNELQSKSSIKKSPVKFSKSVKEIDQYFPSNLTDSESDSDLLPLSKLITNKSTIPTKDPIKKASKLSTSSTKEDSLNELDNSIEIIENSGNSLDDSSNPSNKRRTHPRKAKNRARLRHNGASSTSKPPQSSKNPSILSKSFVSKSPRKVNRKVDSNSKKRLSKSSPREEQCEEEQIFSSEEIPSTSQNDFITTNEVPLNENDNSEIQIDLKNKTLEQIERSRQDKEVTEGALDELKVSKDLSLPEETIIVLGKSNSDENIEENIVESIGKEKERMVNSLSNNELHPEISDTQKLKDSDIDSCRKAPSSDESICIDDTFPNAITTIHSSESGPPTTSPKIAKLINELNKSSPSAKPRNDSPKSITKEPKKVPLTSAVTSKPVPPHSSPQTVQKNSLQSTKQRNDSPKNITQEPQKVPLTSTVTSKPAPPSKSVSKNSPQSTKHRNDSFKNIVKDSHNDSVTLPSNEKHNKSTKIPSSDKTTSLVPKVISDVHPTPESDLKKDETVKPCTSLLSNYATSPEAVLNESLKHSGYEASKLQSLCSTVKEKETNSNNSSLPEIKITSSSDSGKVPLPLKKILPPPKKRIRPIPVTSPNDGGFSPFSPFSSPAHLSTADITSNSNVKASILVNDSTSGSMFNKMKIAEPRAKLPSGKPKAMAEFYKAALPDRSNDLPISPGTVSNSSCTLDTFLARKMLTGSCAKNVNVQTNTTSLSANSLGSNESPKKKLSANNLKYLFTEKSNSFSPLKMPHNVLYPSASSSLFAFFNHGESTVTADENSVKSPLKKDPNNVISSSQSIQQLNSKNADDSSEEEGEIFSPVKTTISKADPVRISPFTLSAQLSPHKKVLPIKNKRKSSPMKAVAVNDCIIPSLSTVLQKCNQDNVSPSVKERKNISSEKTAVTADDQLPAASSMLPIRLSPAKDPVPYEKGQITSPVKAVACNDDILTTLSTSSKKRKRSSSPEIGESHKKWSHLESRKRQRLSSSPEIEGSSAKQSLGNPEFSGKLSEKSPVRSLVPFKDTKPKTVKQRNFEQNPRIPAGVKIPSKWDYSKISTYKTSIENQLPKEESRKEQISNKSQSRRRPSQGRAFQSPKKAYRASLKAHKPLPSELEAYKKSKISHSTKKPDQKQLYKSRNLEDYKFSYRNSPHKYRRPNSTEYSRFRKSDNFTHKENEKSSRETPPKSNWSKASWNSGDKSIGQETEKDTGKSSKSRTPKDKHTQKDEVLSNKIISEKPDHIPVCDERNIANPLKAASPKGKSDSPKVKRKSGNKSISNDIPATPLNSEQTQKPIPQFEEANKIYYESKTSVRNEIILSNEAKLPLPVVREDVGEPEPNILDSIGEPKDTESRTSADQNELNEAVAFLTNDTILEESQQECQVATSSAQAPLIDASSEVQPSGSEYVLEQESRISPGKVLNSEVEGSKKETTGPAEMDLAYLLQRINAVGGFEKLREVMRRK